MLGIVFTEFFDMVDDVFGDEMLDDIINEAALPNDGAYTAVGRYNYEEMLRLVTALSNKTGTPVPDLVKVFGEHLFGRFVVGYPDFFTNVDGSIDFLMRIEDHIHVEVKKLYPEANLPTFDHVADKPNSLKLLYKSDRPFADLAEGLIKGCASHFKEELTLERQDLPVSEGYQTQFNIQVG